MINQLQKSMKKFHLPFCWLLLAAIFIMSAPAVTATAPPHLLTANDLVLPEKPMAPTPPSSPRQQKTDATPKTELPPPAAQTPPAPAKATEAAKQAPAKPPAAEKKSEAPAAETRHSTATANTIAVDENMDKELPPDKDQPASKQPADSFFQSFIHYTLYSILILSILVAAAYFYFTTPNDQPGAPPQTPLGKIARHTTSPSTPAAKAAKPPSAAAQQPAVAPFSNIKINNKSLLEQLVKYDMETYGEIRSNLNYDQPAYIEKLIRKYGGTDPQAVNRAIQLFYLNRQK